MPRMDGIDVSKWQGTIDWKAVQTTGIWWSACRVWDRDLNKMDATFPANRAGQSFCTYKLLYDWLLPGQGVAGAQKFLSVVNFLGAGEAAMLDAEQDGITVQDCLDWLGVVEPVLGRPAAVYTGGYVAGGSIWRSPAIFNGQRARVFAAYCSEADAKRHAQGIAWDCWQWSSTGRVPGIAANCDQDQVDNRAMFDKCCGLSGQVVSGGPKAIIKSGHARKMAGV